MPAEPRSANHDQRATALPAAIAHLATGRSAIDRGAETVVIDRVETGATGPSDRAAAGAAFGAGAAAERKSARSA
jgi:hypothetical protein